jgi:hypothetical protein
MTRIKRFFLTLSLLIALLPCTLALTAPATGYAATYDPLNGACQSADGKSSTTCSSANSTAITGPNGIIVKITRIVAVIAAIIATLTIIGYGIMMTISYGDSSKITSARNGILASVIGLVVIGLAQALVVFVISRL